MIGSGPSGVSEPLRPGGGAGFGVLVRRVAGAHQVVDDAAEVSGGWAGPS